MAPSQLEDLARMALAEDLRGGVDITTLLSIPAGRQGRARLLAKEAGVLAGMPLARAVFAAAAPGSRFVVGAAEDGAVLAPGQCFAEVDGAAAGLLAAERTALNFLQRLSGIATRTRAFVDAVAGTGARILDTRKTTPLLRQLEKDAVRVGGGENHRFGLFDQVLLKENHFAFSGQDYAAVVAAAVAGSDAPVIAESQTTAEGLAALEAGAAVILLDNFAPGPELAGAVAKIRARAAELGRTVEIEASGGVSLQTVRSFAESGVDRISVGSLTHSVAALDLSMLTDSQP